MSIKSNIDKKLITNDDILYLKKAVKYFNITDNISLVWSNSKEKYPDIWVILGNPYQIFITNECATQKIKEKRKRLTHELYHILGNKHWAISKKIKKTHILKIRNKKILPAPLKKFKK